jgi:F-type H+-transporting ATPase subunit epsilon
LSLAQSNLKVELQTQNLFLNIYSDVVTGNMAQQIRLVVVTPEQMVVDEMVEDVAVPGLGGELGVLPEHTFLLSQVQTGVLTYRRDGQRWMLAVSGGYVEVTPQMVSVLAEAAERPEDIDIERARLAREFALKELKAGETELDFVRAQAQLQHSMVRLQVAGTPPEGE